MGRGGGGGGAVWITAPFLLKNIRFDRDRRVFAQPTSLLPFPSPPLPLPSLLPLPTTRPYANAQHVAARRDVRVASFSSTDAAAQGHCGSGRAEDLREMNGRVLDLLLLQQQQHPPRLLLLLLSPPLLLLLLLLLPLLLQLHSSAGHAAMAASTTATRSRVAEYCSILIGLIDSHVLPPY